MSMWSSRAASSAMEVACPECGRMFGRRGLATHRRMRHAPGSPPETTPAQHAPAPPIPPSDATPLHLFDTTAIARALDSLAHVVGRLDGHLDRILTASPAAAEEPAQAASQAATPLTDRQVLERELHALLTEIARVRSEAASIQDPTDSEGTTTADQHKQLGKLRRRQAAILARLLELDGDPGADDLLIL